MSRRVATSVVAALLCAAPAWAAEPAAATGGDEAMGRRVQELLHAHQADVFGCVAAANGAVKGEMLVRVMVGEDQRAAKADVLKDATGLPPLGACITGKVKAWDLKPLGAAAGDQVVFPLVFRPEALQKGEKRVLVPMAAQESSGPQRFILDEETIGEPPLATIEMLTLAGNQATPAKARKEAEEEAVLYVLDGGFKVGADTLKAGDLLWLGAHVDRPAVTPRDGKPLKLLEIRVHGKGAGQKVVHAAEVKSVAVAKGTAKLLLDGTGAALAVDELELPAGATVPTKKNPSQDEIYFMLAGTTTATVGKKSYQTAAGDALRIAPNVTHTIKVTEPLRAIQIYAPGGPEQKLKATK